MSDTPISFRGRFHPGVNVLPNHKNLTCVPKQHSCLQTNSVALMAYDITITLDTGVCPSILPENVFDQSDPVSTARIGPIDSGLL